MKVIIAHIGMAMDRLRTMSVFVTVAEESGFASAGRKLNMSAASVTRAVSELEDRLGAILLHRTTRSVHLTEAGERYFADCRRLLSEIEEIDQQAAGIHGEPRGQVSVTAPVLFGRLVVSPILRDLLDRYSEISLQVTLLDRVVHIVDEGFDVAVRIAELPDSSLTAVRVGSVRKVLCASPGYLSANGRPETPEDLKEHDLIEHMPMTPGGVWQFEEGSNPLAFRPKSRFRTNLGDIAIDAAIEGRGIVRALSYQVDRALNSGDLELVLDEYSPPPIPVHVVHKEGTQASARVRAVVDYLAHEIRAHPCVGK